MESFKIHSSLDGARGNVGRPQGGNGEKSFKNSEKTLHGVLSKRIVTTCDIEKGQEINDNMITTYVTKSDVGMYPNQYFQAIGSKTTRKLNTNHILLVSDFEK